MSFGGIGDDLRTKVLQATELVDLIGQSVALKRRGKDFVGLCPFHQEKSPSFTVSPSKQFFHCYGCKAGGSAIDFIMKRDRVPFLEALRILAERAGIELPRRGEAAANSGERQSLLAMQSAACSIFEKWLADEARGAAARQYLEKRGFTADSIRRFQLGVALDSWDALVGHPLMKKYPPALLAAGGLVKKSEKSDRYYDTFRNRLMFPIRDEAGRVIAFGGRVLPGNDDPAKYLNSPETPLFSKSRCMFGLDAARQSIVEKRTAVVVEGYCDVIGCHQFGVNHTVSILGTALTQQHVTILRRFADRIVLLFDPDVAGEKAVDRAVELFLTQPVEIQIASIPSGQDPDEFLLASGTEEFEKLLANASDALAYKWKQLLKQYAAAGDMTGQQKAVETYLSLLAAARGAGSVDALRWGAVLARVSRLTGIATEDLNRRFRPKRASRPVAARPPAGQSQDVEPGEVAGVDEDQSPPLSLGRLTAEREILGILLLEPNYWQQTQRHIGPVDFADRSLRGLAEALWEIQRHEQPAVLQELLGFLGPLNLASLATELVEQMGKKLERMESPAQAVPKMLAENVKFVLYERARSSRPAATDENDEALLRRLQDEARRPDLRRLGH